MIAARTSDATAQDAARSLVSLLGEQRAGIVEQLRRGGDASVAELASYLGISQVATRRHLTVLEEDGLIEARTVPQGRGRPPARYHLTEAAAALFPQRYDALAAEMFAFLTDTHGRDGLRAFLRWRLKREVDGLREAVTAEGLEDRLQQLSAALSDAGYEASVTTDGDAFTLRQRHCTIEGIARDHPEICAYEAASFARVLGEDVVLSRRETLADGAGACVCHVRARSGGGSPATEVTTETARAVVEGRTPAAGDQTVVNQDVADPARSGPAASDPAAIDHPAAEPDGSGQHPRSTAAPTPATTTA